MKNNKGITLVEILLTLAIAGILLSVAFSLQFFGIRSFRTGTTQAEVQQTARVIDEVLRSQSRIRNAIALTTDENEIELGERYWLNLDEDNRLFYGKYQDGPSIQFDDGLVISIKMEADEKDVLKYTITVGSYELSNRLFLNNIGEKNKLSGQITLEDDPLFYSVP